MELMHLDATKFTPRVRKPRLKRNPGSRCEIYSSVALKISCIKSASISNFSFPLHTYLVRREAITKAFSYDLSPALHIAEAKVIELLSGTSFAQFLMVFPYLE